MDSSFDENYKRKVAAKLNNVNDDGLRGRSQGTRKNSLAGSGGSIDQQAAARHAAGYSINRRRDDFSEEVKVTFSKQRRGAFSGS